jgi:hypothetical protein
VLIHAGTSAAASALAVTLTNQVRSGLNISGTYWGGMGITSSVAAADTNHVTAIGILVNNNGLGAKLYGSGGAKGLFDGQDAATSDVLVKETYFGDADLSGSVNAADYSRIDNGFAMHLTGWVNGDFNYDGTVDAADYSMIDSSFGLQGSPLADAAAVPNASVLAALPDVAVPEPSGLMLLAAAGGLLLLRHHSNRWMVFDG